MPDDNIVPKYKIINSENKGILTDAVIEQMSIMNTIDHRSLNGTQKFLKESLESPNFLICLAYYDKEFVGFSYGNLEENTFKLERFFVKPKFNGKKIGTYLFAHFFGYLRHKHNVDTIKMTSYLGTHEINKKLTGQKEITIIREELDPNNPSKTIKKVIKQFRNFDNSRFIYNLASKPIKEKGRNGIMVLDHKVDDRVSINTNPYRKKNNVKRSVAK